MKLVIKTSIWAALITVGKAEGELGFLSSGLRGKVKETPSLANVPTELTKKTPSDIQDMSIEERTTLLGEVGGHISETIEALSHMDFSENEMLEFFAQKALEEGQTSLKLIADASYFLQGAAKEKLLPESTKQESGTDPEEQAVATASIDLARLSRFLKEAEEEEINKQGNTKHNGHRRAESEPHGKFGGGFGGQRHGFHTNRLFHINKMQDAIQNGDHGYLNRYVYFTRNEETRTFLLSFV